MRGDPKAASVYYDDDVTYTGSPGSVNNPMIIEDFWDLRRLRMLDRLDGKTKFGVEAIAINPDGSEMSIAEAKAKAAKNELKEADFKYTVHQIPFTGVKISSVPEKYYFFPIKQSVIDLNSNIEQNSNWGGTFNPTLE
jgi:hypothetical protein